ncbi:hypothetical protein WOLCODRAFT_85334 [Wolfiporia cocos MD-104 SS10]|uniref:HAT C-terminal dimerisation domain-containing protein n=1 Tax=Wolfiporia cocos (strain MD-104) TaxID=742152 RepID=A0A2H3JNG7_WOLCO|nr:hypothetical protein WOLCODRAFT_85334 [Wolfiporia cocos MD-104 SS10]
MHDFPVLSHIACDFLSVPAASITVECLFSSSHCLCANTHSSLKAETIAQAMCIKKWLHEGIIELA